MRFLLVSLAVFFIAGCNNSKWQVSCDSGYSTGSHDIAYASDKGVVVFGSNEGGLTKRKMIPGESCKTYKTKP